MTLLTQVQNAGLVQRLDALDLQLRDDIRATLLQSGDQTYIDLAGQVHDLGDEAAANQLIVIEAARAGRLPQLITLADLQGDLHLHTKAFNGRNSIREMARRGWLEPANVLNARGLPALCALLGAGR